MGVLYGRYIWASYMGVIYGRHIYGRHIWALYMGVIYGLTAFRAVPPQRRMHRGQQPIINEVLSIVGSNHTNRYREDLKEL